MKKISDFNSATEKYPVVYAGSATRPEFVDMPTTLQQQEGVAPMDTLPAQWWNAMWKLATKDINAFRDFVGDAFTEINNLLTEFGITLDDADTDQLYDFFHDDYVQNYLKPIFVQKSGDTIDGDLHIKGDLIVDGIGEEVISTELKVGANTITLRNDNPSALGNTELAGVVTENYDGNNHNNIIAIDKSGVARTGDIDIATRILYSNDGTNFYTDEDLTIPATIGADEEVRDTGNQTSGGVEIYEGITYSNNDTQAIATREDNPTDGAFMKWDAATKKLVSASASLQFDIAWPIGVTYTQYPGQKDPNQLWGQYSTWEELNYGGAFFRSNGGNADVFEKSLAISSMNGTTIVFQGNHGLSVGSVIYDSVHNEGRVVTSVTNTTTIVINTAFSSPSLPNVYIGQAQTTAKNGLAVSTTNTLTLKSQNNDTSSSIANTTSSANTNHTHVMHGGGAISFQSKNWYLSRSNISHNTSGGGSAPFGLSTGTDTGMTTGYMNANASHAHNIYLRGSVSTSISSTNTETQPNNLTYKIWVRTA